MAEAATVGVQGDLEKELTCSICTDLLYQPLTLLDCLHTFCGACLKEWFAFQASTATSIHPYTCPSCRASVRTTQPNATVTTLLDIFLKANPARGKSDDEKKADRDKYRPGDNVLPKLRRRDERDEADQRILDQVQQLSLREVGIPSGRSNPHLEPPRERRRRERSREGSRESRRSRDERRSASRTPLATSPSRTVIPPRAVEHQSSLRSLLSASELDSSDIDEGLVHQVLEELMAEGMDLTQIGAAQEEEITERIAEAVRRRQAERHAERQRERRERRERMAREGLTSSSSSSLVQPIRSPPARGEEVISRRAHVRSESAAAITSTAVGPPISRPGLIDAANRGGRSHRPRSSSQGSSRSARRADPPAALVTYPDSESERIWASSEAPGARRRESEHSQRSRLDARQQFRNSLRTTSNPNSPRGQSFNVPTNDSPTSSLAVLGSSQPLSTSTPAITPFQPPNIRRTTDPARNGRPDALNAENRTPPPSSSSAVSQIRTDSSAHGTQMAQHSGSATSLASTYTEPSITCQHCGKEHIEYELHYNCSCCEDGEYNICIRCYRNGKGCKHWFGFGWTAWERYERQAPEGGYPPNHELPHILVGHRYQRPSTPLIESSTPPYVLMTEMDPRQRLQTGVFCDICKADASACYWKCDYCNEGDWGYCNDCINQGYHCTHPLTPVAKKDQTTTSSYHNSSPSAPSTPNDNGHLAPPERGTTPTTPPLTPKSASLLRGPGFFTIAKSIYRPLTFTTLCNVCRSSIPPSNTRYHCLKCNAGDYDICMNCYHKLVVSGRIGKEDGVSGWRKCLRGHRMVIVGFEDCDGGQRRVVVRDLVGGFALKEDEEMQTITRLQRYPPDGGAGLRLTARWGYWPEEGVNDELSFPRGAQIREAADINGDWYWGVYCGSKGLFPANYVIAS